MRAQYIQDRRELEMVSERIMELPSGGVYSHRKGRYMAYDHEYYENGKRIRRNVRKDEVDALKQQTALRRQLKRYKKVLKERIADMEAKMRVDGTDPAEVWKEYLDNVDKNLVMRQESAMNIACDYHQSNVYTTFTGVNVRSKAEVIISDRLTLNGIPHFYEKPLIIDGIKYKPDFTIYLNGQMIIWEHVGLMDSETYRANWEAKKKAYAKAGFIEGKNLIVTYEHTGFDTIEVQYLIDQYFRRYW